MFPQKLERIIRPLASKIIESKVKDSKSIYYEVDDVRIRLSDHPAHSMDYDLANTLVMGGLMTVLSFLLAWLMNKQARMRRVIEWRMVDVLRETDRVIHKKKKK
jgi:hypothetical protein